METTLNISTAQRLNDKAGPASAQPRAGDGTPPELQAEILLELIGTVTAKLARAEAAEASPAKRARLAQVRKALLAKRFEFDPHQPEQVRALIQEFSAHADALSGAAAPTSAGG